MILATYLTLLIILVTSLVYSAYAYDLIYEHESYPLCEIEYKTKKIKDKKKQKETEKNKRESKKL